jgi:hypothetical protein
MVTIHKHRVTLGTLDFNDRLLKPVGAQHWGVDVLDGWKAGPDLSLVSNDLGGDRDGEVAAEYSAYKARHLIIGGYVVAPDEETAEELHDRIVRESLPRNQTILLARYEAVPKYMRVRRDGPVETDWTLPNGFRWMATLRADDPLKYDMEASSGTASPTGVSTNGRIYPRVYPLMYSSGVGDSTGATRQVTLFNRGTTYSYATAVLYGPLTSGGWRLSNDTVGTDIRYPVTLGDNDRLEINFQQESALLNGYPLVAEAFGDFWRVAPGENIIKLYANDAPGAGFTVSVDSAWE